MEAIIAKSLHTLNACSIAGLASRLPVNANDKASMTPMLPKPKRSEPVIVLRMYFASIGWESESKPTSFAIFSRLLPGPDIFDTRSNVS